MLEHLHRQIQALREHLDNNPPEGQADREHLKALLAQLELNRQTEGESFAGGELSDGIKYAAERFEVSHPATAAVLRNLLQSLSSMGI